MHPAPVACLNPSLLQPILPAGYVRNAYVMYACIPPAQLALIPDAADLITLLHAVFALANAVKGKRKEAEQHAHAAHSLLGFGERGMRRTLITGEQAPIPLLFSCFLTLDWRPSASCYYHVPVSSIDGSPCRSVTKFALGDQHGFCSRPAHKSAMCRQAGHSVC